MKKIKTLFVFILLPLLFSGCLQVETTLFVKKDGSGTINEKVLFSKTFVNMIKDFAQAFQDSSSTEEFNLYEEENIIGDAKDYGDGVVYVSHEKIDNNNWEGYQVIYSFDDVSKIKIAPDPDSKIDLEEEAVSNELHKEFYFFKFIKGDTPQLIIDRPDIELSSDSNETADSTDYVQNDDEEGEEYVKLMEGMKIDILVQVDGEIENTNATYVDGSKVTLFQMDFGEMMKNKEAFEDFKRNEPQNIDELKLYLDKLEGIKIEVEEPITINFK
jgi:hypothetical protein